MSDKSKEFAGRIRDAAASGRGLRLRGGGTKDFYGSELDGEILDTRAHRGILSYEPTELVISARAGTPLAEIEAALAEKGQMLAFEPPRFAEGEIGGATLGGCIAAGLSGPRRATAGAARDFVLGVKILDGRGETQGFGGQVMKNVAGYDVSRLMAGSLGTLGLMLEVSLKVLPVPVAGTGLRLAMDQAQALEAMNRWSGQPLPISGTCWHDGQLAVRLSGARAAVASAKAVLGGTVMESDLLWLSLREQNAPFFVLEPNENLWRLSLPPTAPMLTLPGETLIEWGGALRWLKTDADPNLIRRTAVQAGGHATLYQAPESLRAAFGAFQPLPPAMEAVQWRLKQAFDPAGILNPGRMYSW